jgi:hypothetical protein
VGIYPLVFGLFLLSTYFGSPHIIYLFLVSFYLLVFGVSPSSTYTWSVLLSTFLRSPPVHFSFVYSVYLLVLVSSFYLTCFWYPPIIYISLISLFYLLVFGLLFVFDILPLYYLCYPSFSTCF